MLLILFMNVLYSIIVYSIVYYPYIRLRESVLEKKIDEDEKYINLYMLKNQFYKSF